MAKLKYAKNIVTDVYRPESMNPETIKRIEEWNHLILWIDEKVVPGSFQMNCCWYIKVPEKQTYFQHKHDVPEIIGLFGSDCENPHDMCGEVEFWMEEEKYIIDKSCMIFVPAGVKHCPLYIKRVDRPIFHYTVVTSPLYSTSK
jgi:hypothetical protein